jgi:hypothetical protein
VAYALLSSALVERKEGGVLNVEIRRSWNPYKALFKSSKTAELSRHLHFQLAIWWKMGSFEIHQALPRSSRCTLESKDRSYQTCC